jgi:DNA-binding SARP family transcriptional activator
MEFGILGPLEVVDGGRTLPLGGRRQRALLTVLILHANQVVPTEFLLDQVWGGEQPASGAGLVQVYVSELRKALGDGVIETRAPCYVRGESFGAHAGAQHGPFDSRPSSSS